MRFMALACLFILIFAPSANPKIASSLRWTESDPHCAFRAEDDGTYRYAIAAESFAITLALDAQELEKSRKRQEPVLGLFLSVRFLTGPPASFPVQKIALEFVDHFHASENPLDPDELVARLRARLAFAEHAAAESIEKHPQKKDEIEAGRQEEKQQISQTIDWIKTSSLKATNDNHDFAGWLLFATKIRWVGQLNPQEEFVLRVPLGKEMVEFPFTLPPSRGDIRLRTRPTN
jgi:hypothetical protein